MLCIDNKLASYYYNIEPLNCDIEVIEPDVHYTIDIIVVVKKKPIHTNDPLERTIISFYEKLVLFCDRF